MEFLNNLKKETKELLTAIFSTIKEVDETQVNKLIYMVEELEDANWQLSLLNPHTTTYKRLEQGVQNYRNELFNEIYKLCNKKNILEDSVINTLEYYAGIREKYFKRSSNKA